MRILPVLILLLLVIASCSDSSNSNSKNQAPDPLKGYVFLWDFNGKDQHVYDYEMKSISKESRGKSDEPFSIMEEVHGDFILESNGNRQADVSIQDVIKTVYSSTEDGQWSSGNPQSQGDIRLGSLKQYSKFENPRLDAVWDAFLPLPLEEIKNGETYMLKMKIPVTMENNKYVRGTNKLVFDGYSTVNGFKCIRLVGEIDVSEVDELDFNGVYEHSLIGKGIYYFSPEDHFFVEANVELKLRLFIDAENMKEERDQFFLDAEYTDILKLKLKQKS